MLCTSSSRASPSADCRLQAGGQGLSAFPLSFFFCFISHFASSHTRRCQSRLSFHFQQSVSQYHQRALMDSQFRIRQGASCCSAFTLHALWTAVFFGIHRCIFKPQLCLVGTCKEKKNDLKCIKALNWDRLVMKCLPHGCTNIFPFLKCIYTFWFPVTQKQKVHVLCIRGETWGS